MVGRRRERHHEDQADHAHQQIGPLEDFRGRVSQIPRAVEPEKEEEMQRGVEEGVQPEHPSELAEPAPAREAARRGDGRSSRSGVSASCAPTSHPTTPSRPAIAAGVSNSASRTASRASSRSRNATFVALGLNRDIRKVVDDALRTAKGRFAQNAATQEDVTKLEIEIADLDTEVARLDAQVLKTAAQLNALLSRRPDGPLARPNGFRRLPPDRLMTAAALADRAALDNAEVAEGEAKVLAATAGRDLAGRNRYPDLSVGPMYSQENSAGTNHFGSAGVAASFSIPLQWDAKEADIRAAAAGKRAAEARVSALKLRVASEVAGLVADYRASAKALAIMRNHHLPEAQVALKAAIGTAESDTPSLSDVFTASQRTLRIRLDVLKLETEQQVTIAEIEKTIGGDL